MSSQATRPTISVRQPLASATPLPEGLVIMQDQQAVLNYDPGWYSEYFIQEGMDSVAMSHLINPPTMPISPLPNPRDANCRLSSQNLTMYAESARIQVRVRSPGQGRQSPVLVLEGTQ